MYIVRNGIKVLYFFIFNSISVHFNSVYCVFPVCIYYWIVLYYTRIAYFLLLPLLYLYFICTGSSCHKDKFLLCVTYLAIKFILILILIKEKYICFYIFSTDPWGSKTNHNSSYSCIFPIVIFSLRWKKWYSIGTGWGVGS